MNAFIRLFMIAALTALGGSRAAFAQNQTNVNVYGQQKDTTAVKDTLKVLVPKDTLSTRNPDLAPPDTSHEVGAIAPSDEKVLQRRKQAKDFAAAGFGPAGFGNIDEKTPSYDLYLGHFWEVNRFAAIKALGEVASDLTRTHMADVNLGANFYAAPTDFAPYVGGALGMGVDRSRGDNAYGFNVGASVGALLFRTASAQMNIEGNAQMLMSDLHDKMPQVYSARLGVLF